MSSRSATSCWNARPRACRSPWARLNSMRMKNSPPSGSVECWSELMMFAPEAARKPATAATIPCRSGQLISSRPRTGPLGAVALLELLARAAPARVVAAEVRVLVDPPLGDHGHVVPWGLAGLAVGVRLILERAARVGERAQTGRRLLRGIPLRGRRLLLRAVAVRALDLDLDVVDHAREVGPDRVHQVVEEREGLVLVGHERLDLGEPAQVDALAQVVHVVEVLAPALIDDLEHEIALERAHELLAELGLALVVERHRVLGEQPLELLAVDRRAVDLVRAEVDLVDLLELDPELVEVPVVREVARRVLVHQAADDLGDLLAGDGAHVAALEHLVAVAVDDLALLVHHVVVLEDALADEVVLLLDLALRVLDLLREHLRLDRLFLAVVAPRAEPVQDLVDPVAGEQAHEVVLGGEEEARVARIALGAGAPAQLVGDPARLVALRAADEQAAGLLDARAAGL